MAQKSHFKMQQQGITEWRKLFPSLPGNTVQNPTYIQTAHGNKLLTSGWWAWARKPVRRCSMFLWPPP
jgi:Delta24(24(1))-sterol reductase